MQHMPNPDDIHPKMNPILGMADHYPIFRFPFPQVAPRPDSTEMAVNTLPVGQLELSPIMEPCDGACGLIFQDS